MTNVTAIGRLTADPKIGQTNNGKIFANFSIADGNGKTVFYHNAYAFDRTAEIIRDYARKGTMVAITGNLTQREYETKSGIKQRVTEIAVTSIHLLSPKPEAQTSAPVSKPEASTVTPAAAASLPNDDVFIPF